MIANRDRNSGCSSSGCSIGRGVGQDVKLNILIGQERLYQSDALGGRHGLSGAVYGSDGNVDCAGRIVSSHSRGPHHFTKHRENCVDHYDHMQQV